MFCLNVICACYIRCYHNTCDIIKEKVKHLQSHIKYGHIFSEGHKQVEAAQYLHHLFSIRADLIMEDPAYVAGP